MNDNKFANELIEKVKAFGNIIAGFAEQVEDFQKQLDDFKTDGDKKIRRGEKGKYYYTVSNFGKIVIHENKENRSLADDLYFENNNYFLSKDRAQQVADKLNFLLRLERLHDELCPDYVPDWNNYEEEKFIIAYDYEDGKNKYIWGYNLSRNTNTAYFPTEEIAQKACDILNEEAKQREQN